MICETARIDDMNIRDLRQKLGHTGIINNGNFYALREIEKNPNKIALKFPILDNGNIKYQTLTFKELKDEALKISRGFEKQGFKRGDRVVLLFPISVKLYLCIFACLYLGLVPVFIDSSMGIKKLIKSIRDSRAKGIISIDKLLKFKLLVPSLWFKKCFSMDKKRFLVKKFCSLEKLVPLDRREENLDASTCALITFTSGSTGRPKGANRSIDILLNQKIVSEYLWPHGEYDIDMPAFPMIVLQNLGCGITSVLPAMNHQNFLDMDAKLIVKQIRAEKISRFSAQPYFIENLCDYLIEKKINLPSVKSLVVGGAVVSKKLCKKIRVAFSDVHANIVYGSTEAEPIAYTNIDNFLKASGRGVLVGSIVEVLNLKILKILEKPNIDKDEVSKTLEEVGEIVISGPHVVREYIDNHPANYELKLKSISGKIWHRTGDMGYLDKDDNLWIVGRIKDQIYSNNGQIPCYDLEEDLLSIKGITRAAFIEDNQTLFLERSKNDHPNLNFVENFLKENGLCHFSISILDKLPVDKRHFSRIDRAKLRKTY